MADLKERDFYTVTEAAAALAVSPSTVWRWIVANRLPAYRVGARTIRIDKADVRRIVRPVHPVLAVPPPLVGETMTLGQWQARTPPTPEELDRRQAAVSRILADLPGPSIAPLTTSDLVQQVREEREERYRSWLTPSS